MPFTPPETARPAPIHLEYDVTTWQSLNLIIAHARVTWGTSTAKERAVFAVLATSGVTLTLLAIVGARNIQTVALCLLWALVAFGAAWLTALSSIDRALQQEATAQYLAIAGGDHVLHSDSGPGLRYKHGVGWVDAD